MKPLRFLAGVVVLGFLPYASIVGVLRRVTRDWNPVVGWVVADLIPVLAALAAVVLYERVSRGGSVRSALVRLGLGRPRWRVLVAGFLAGLPAWATLGLAMMRPGVELTPVRHVGMTVIRVILAQALLEELVFRGLAFRRLAEQLPLRRAAILASIAFGLSHVGNLVGKGVAPPVLVEVSIQIFLTTVIALAPIRLVWNGSGLLWGACIWHLMIDTSIFFPGVTPDAPSALLLVFGTLATLPASWTASRLLLRGVPQPAPIASPGHRK
jgi:membrane protease YdiL (CAAX protease family)